jgi:ribosomal protein S18 acetylase RimI-like enzyme
MGSRRHRSLPVMTKGLELQPASSLDLPDYAALFNAAYEGYLIPFHIDENTVAAMTAAFDLDADASRIAYRDGVAVGLGNLGIRGEDGWIGGVGVIVAARRSGVGETLMRALHEQARERGLRRVWLEVIVENTGAFALYEKLGYRTIRDVEMWSLSQSDEGGSGASEVPAADAHARIRALRSGREPWQRADQTVENYNDTLGLATDDDAAVYRRAGADVQLLQLAGNAVPLLRSLRRLGKVNVLNLPEDDPAVDVLRDLGATVVVRQHEMLLELSH